MCSSIGRFPILQPPGNGISRVRNRLRRAGKRNIQTRIFLTSSVSRLARLILVLSSMRVFHWKSTITPSDSMIERKVKTSPIRGTLWSVNFSKKRPQAMSGRVAFLDPDISTIPERSWGQWRESIEKFKIIFSINPLYSIGI